MGLLQRSVLQTRANYILIYTGSIIKDIRCEAEITCLYYVRLAYVRIDLFKQGSFGRSSLPGTKELKDYFVLPYRQVFGLKA